MQLSKKEVQTRGTRVDNNVGKTFDISTNQHKKRTMIAILSLSLCFLLATTFGLQAVFRNKVDPGLQNTNQAKKLSGVEKDGQKIAIAYDNITKSLTKDGLSVDVLNDEFVEFFETILNMFETNVAGDGIYEYICNNEYFQNLAKLQNESSVNESDKLRAFSGTFELKNSTVVSILTTVVSVVYFGGVVLATAIATGLISAGTITALMGAISFAFALVPGFQAFAVYMLAIAAVVAGVFITSVVTGKSIYFPYTAWIIPCGYPYI